MEQGSSIVMIAMVPVKRNAPGAGGKVEKNALIVTGPVVKSVLIALERAMKSVPGAGVMALILGVTYVHIVMEPDTKDVTTAMVPDMFDVCLATAGAMKYVPHVMAPEK